MEKCGRYVSDWVLRSKQGSHLIIHQLVSRLGSTCPARTKLRMLFTGVSLGPAGAKAFVF